MKASVIIPTKNAGKLFERVIDAVLSQEAPWPYDVLVVDSGSTDGTVEHCRSRGVRVLSIEPREFGHGRTRNLGISETGGEFVALLTHDALPASPHWLRELVAAVEAEPDIAGAFGRHLPYPDANPSTSRDLKLHFDGFLALPRVMRLDDPERYARDVGYRQVLHYFSDNNACLRRSVWERHPYPDVDFAEDQIWAKTIIEAGYGKAYADAAAVYHSHSYSVVEVARRSFDEAAALHRLFGYEMGPSLRHLANQSVRCTLRDFADARRNGRVVADASWLVRAPFHHTSRQIGYYLGNNERRMPRWLLRRVSLDKKLQNIGSDQDVGSERGTAMSLSRLRAIRQAHKKLGGAGFAKLVAARLLNGGPLSREQPPKQDVVGFYSFMRADPFGADFDAALHGGKTINWVIPDFGIGSGGHINIFRLVMLLERAGYKCHISIVGPVSHASAADARDSIRKNFFPVEASVGLGPGSLRPAAITVATSWITAYAVKNFRTTAHKCYFVQDYEPYFTARGSDHFFAEATYNFGFSGIAAGDWLAGKLSSQHGMRMMSMGFSYDRDLYRVMPRRSPERRRIFFYARPVTPRRSFELGLLALHRVHELYPRAEFILAGWDTSNYVVPFPHLNAGTVPLTDLADLYSQCDVALVISGTNLSLLPLELMACGCPVVSNNGPNVAWLLNDRNAVLRDATPNDLADGILALLNDDERRAELSKAGLEFARSTDWEVEARKVAHFFDELLASGLKTFEHASEGA